MGNVIAADLGAGLKDLIARMGHDSVRTAMIYQHAVRGADKLITEAIDRTTNQPICSVEAVRPRKAGHVS